MRKKSTDFNKFQRQCRGVGEKADFQSSLYSMGSCVFGLHPYTLASILQILYIFYIFLLDSKRYIRNMTYMGGIYQGGGEEKQPIKHLQTHTYSSSWLAVAQYCLTFCCNINSDNRRPAGA